MVDDHAAKRTDRGLAAKMAAYVTDAQAPLRIAVIVMGTDRASKTARVPLGPSGALGLLVGRARRWIEVEREDQVGMESGILRLGGNRASKAINRLPRCGPIASKLLPRTLNELTSSGRISSARRAHACASPRCPNW